VRYGAGPLITMGAELLASLVRAQAEMRRPLGLTLRRMGGRPLPNYLADPYVSFRRGLFLTRCSRWLPRLERWLGVAD
jgi:hypothetical protein